ncbi:MAG TPA: hypothetical protein PKC39_13540 [Ferruginibacter sp.]|mgnify:CR=1 FL=1|nr:hypothetical protein [Ferruginibacter sp.]HMP21978.1 hypothetical protein [Ferruginibacter sp.]
MTEVFITNIQNKVQAQNILNKIKAENPELKVNFDLNETEKAYPCGHTILRVEGYNLNSDYFITTVRNLDYKCNMLEDKACV